MTQEPPNSQDSEKKPEQDSTQLALEGIPADRLTDNEDFLETVRAVVMGEVMDQVPKDLSLIHI